MLFLHGSPNSCSTSILINNKPICTVLDPLGYFISKVQVDDKVYAIVNIYAPNKHTLLQSENLDSEENVTVPSAR